MVTGPKTQPVRSRAPLTPSPYTALPAGSVSPRSWLRRQMVLSAEGLVGHLGRISPYLSRAQSAWFSADGQGSNGGEELPYWLRGYSQLAYALADGAMIDHASEWFEAIMASGRRDGYFGPENLRSAVSGSPDLLPHCYVVHGLRSYYEWSGDNRVAQFLLRYYRYQMGIADDAFFADGWQHYRVASNLISVYWLYNLTGETFLLDLAKKTHRAGAPLARETHNVNLCESFHEATLFSAQSKRQDDRDSAECNYHLIRDQYGQVPGGMFGADEQTRGGFFGPRQGIETCGVVEMMRSCEALVAFTGSLDWAERLEEIAYNTLPATMTPDLRALRYLTAPNLVASVAGTKVPDFYNLDTQLLMDPQDYRCCRHNVGQGWPGFCNHSWYATEDGGMLAATYAPCVVRGHVGVGVPMELEVDTHYPFADTIDIRIRLSRPEEFPLTLRIPQWCDRPEISISGIGRVEATTTATTLRRQWRDGDSIRLRLPMSTRVERWKKNKDAATVYHGPLALSLSIDEVYKRTAGTEEWPAYAIRPGSPWNYALCLEEPGSEEAFTIRRRPWPEDDQPFTPQSSPLVVEASAARLPAWGTDHLEVVEPVPQSPVRKHELCGSVDLVPMGAARLRVSVFPVAAPATTGSRPAGAGDRIGPGRWEMGPFLKERTPLLEPNDASTFRCPIRQAPVAWESLNVYNPAVVVRGTETFLLYRADDQPWSRNEGGAMWRTSRIGLAVATDGRTFQRHPEPVLYPDRDKYRDHEWPGGCEDIHVVENDDGVCYLYYTTWNGRYDTMSVATSRDLVHWEKQGPVFHRHSPEAVKGSRSGVVVTELRDGVLRPVRLQGKYIMYFTHPSIVAESDDLIHWRLTGKQVWPDGRHESGAIALLRDDGILLLFNGQNWGDLPFFPGTWTLGQALVDRDDLTTVLAHEARPFMYPEFPWEWGNERYRPMVLPPLRDKPWSPEERRPEEAEVTLAVVANTLVPFGNSWHLYYGAADRVIGLATCPFDLVTAGGSQ